MRFKCLLVTFRMVLYRNQRPVNFILPFAELHIGSSIRYEKTLLGNYFLKCYIVKRILVSFNCFSEYIIVLTVQLKCKTQNWNSPV